MSAQQKEGDRLSVALVLSGGGALGFAHIPVLEELEKSGIPIDLVVGSSAGAIVGGLYCSGYSPEEIKKELISTKWSWAFQDKVTSPFEKTFGEHAAFSTPFVLNLGNNKNNNLNLQMGQGLLTGQRAYEKVRALTLKIPSNTDFDTLPIPFRAVGLNLINGNIEIFSSGDIAESMRASFSIPGFFQPFEIDGNYYVDCLTRNNSPINIPYEMGYDIIIVSDVSEKLLDDPAEFDSNPLVTVYQVANIETSVRLEQYRQYSDLFIEPYYADYTVMDYESAGGIYKTSQKSMIAWRSAFKVIKKVIFQEKDPPIKKDTRKKATRDKKLAYSKHYSENKDPVLCKMIVKGADESDIPMIEKEFSHYKGVAFSSKDYRDFSEFLYRTAKYTNIVMRINESKEGNILFLIMHKKPVEKGRVLLGINYQGSISTASSSMLSGSADIQFKGLTGVGSLLSLKATAVGDDSIQITYFQPLFLRIFLQGMASYELHPAITGSGWLHHPIKINLMREAHFSLKFGFPFNDFHTLLAGSSINWYDTKEKIPLGAKSWAGDFSAKYVLNVMDTMLFPSRGAYIELKGTGILPITEHKKCPIAEIVTLDIAGAIPFNFETSLLLNCFAGMNISQQLEKVPELLPVYGFTLADRYFFPNVPIADSYGLHKFVVGAALRYIPSKEVTLLGGKAVFGISGAVGNVWKNYEDLSLKDLEWRASLDMGLRISDTFGILFRLGVGTTPEKLSLPFISLDIGNIRY